MITPYVITEVITSTVRGAWQHLTQSLMSRCLSILFALWLPEDLVIWLKTLVGTNLGLCCQAGEIPSLNFPSTLSSVINPGGCPTFFNLQFH